MATSEGPSGLLLVDKEAGPTSHDIVDSVRRALRTRQVGHAGTLDPLATGLLACCVGSATRLVRWFTASRKTYEGVIELGRSTDTGDAAGRVTGEAAVSLEVVERQKMASALAALTGTLEQVPPMVSAKKQQGTPLHALARQGLVVPREPVRIRVHSFVAESGALEPHRLRFRVECSAGTYVRVLAEDLGALLGVPAHLASLRRVAAGGLRVEDALPSDRLIASEAERSLIPLDRLPLPLPGARLAGTGESAFFRQGRAVERAGWEDEGRADGVDGSARAVRDQAGHLLGVGEATPDGRLAPRVVLAE